MRALIVGAGAVGTFLGATLAAAGAEVTLVDRGPAGVAAGGAPVDAPVDASVDSGVDAPVDGGESSTLVIEGGTVQQAVSARRIASVADLAFQPDVALIAVKMFDLVAALESLERWPSMPVLTVQNGIGAEAEAARIRSGTVLGGSLTAAVEPAGRGRVRRLRRGGMGIALARGGSPGLAEELTSAFTAGRLPARRFEDAIAMKWSKLLGNLVANATSAILDLEPAAIYADPRLFALERAQILEALRVMAALGRSPIGLPGADARLVALAFRLPPSLGRFAMGRVVGGARGGKWPSLALHVRSGVGLPTEAPWLNGGVASTGATLGVATPVNAVLARLVDEVAASPERRTWFRGRPDRLVAEVRTGSPG